MENISVGRQPIFDEKGNLWGYDLFCVGATESVNAAVAIQSGTSLGLNRTINNPKKIVVDLNEKDVLDRAPDALPPGLTVIKITEQAGRQTSVLEVLADLRSKGYEIAVGGFTGDRAARICIA